MNRLSRKSCAALIIVLAVLIFAGFNGVFDALVTGVRLDLTENGRFTLSDGTRSVVSRMKTAMTLKFYYSRKIAADYPQTRAYAGRVHDLLQRYAALSHGKIKLTEVDPEPYSPEEDEAAAAGLTPAPTGSGENVYFGLVATTADGRSDTIAYFAPTREPDLEYDITRMIDGLTRTQKPRLAIVSGMPLAAGQTGRPLALYSELAQTFDVEPLTPDFTAIPAATKVLMLIQPGKLTDAQLYAIDQFALKGGHVAVFVDPDSELTSASSGMPAYLAQATGSDLPKLFRAWGIGFTAQKVVGDLELAQKVQTYRNGAPAVALYPVWLHVSGDAFDSSDPVSADLQSLNLASAGALYPLKGATTRMRPLLRSSGQAGLLDPDAVHKDLDPDAVTANIVPDGQRYTLAARVWGPAHSAFPDGAPAPDASKPGAKPTDKDAPDAQLSPPAPAAAAPVKAGNVNVIVVADTDLFDDRFWVRSTGQTAMGQTAMEPFADNGAFVLDIVENLMGSDELIALRTRKSGDKPFTLVLALQAEAEAQYRQEAQSLEARLTETKSRLQELEAQGGKADAKRQVEIEQFRRQLAATRLDLRAVQRNLRRDIDALGDVLAFANIVLVPVLVILFALAQGWWRRRRRRRQAR